MGALGLAADLSLKRRGRGFTPKALFRGSEAGCWYDPSDLGSMSQNSGGSVPAALNQPVGRIADKSGRGNHAVQASAAARPVLRQDGGGRLYLDFDGIDDFLSASFGIAQPWDRISAVRQNGWADGARLLSSPSAGGVGSLYQRTASPQLRIYSGVLGPITSNASLGANLVVRERHDGSASRIGLGGADAATGDAGTAVPGGIEIGAMQGGILPASFRLYGVAMVGRALGEAEAARTARFMAARAGVAL